MVIGMWLFTDSSWVAEFKTRRWFISRPGNPLSPYVSFSQMKESWYREVQWISSPLINGRIATSTQQPELHHFPLRPFAFLWSTELLMIYLVYDLEQPTNLNSGRRKTPTNGNFIINHRPKSFSQYLLTRNWSSCSALFQCCGFWITSLLLRSTYTLNPFYIWSSQGSYFGS